RAPDQRGYNSTTRAESKPGGYPGGFMLHVTRRAFVETLGTAAGLGCAPYVAPVSAGAPDPSARTVHLSGDGIALTPREHAALLDQLCRDRKIAEDTYLLGGEVEQFERHWAQLLGKERAVFMPSGTLANHLALRALAGTRRRVIVPEMSHIYNDTGDACQTLSGQTLMPLGPGRATFTVADVEAVLARTEGGRVATEVGAIAIESPIRRLSGQMFDWDEATRLAALAKARGIGLHLDGARLFIASAYTGITPADYAAPFDTVYVSLWKYFNSGIGAILAGPSALLDGMFHTRRMFGGNLAVGWNAALVARHFMDGFEDRLKHAVAVSEAFYTALAGHPRVLIARIPNGTNLTRVTFTGIAPAVVAARLAEHGVVMPAGSAGQTTVTLGVNETWTRTTAAELTRAFEQALA
ncbi:MAG TPA: beta-eliminating lyase-related protein, partial [Vicinamibacterales bacterium]|nr:beta-eliminating lyase-related protein [Vicinamibacterales bacterium]